MKLIKALKIKVDYKIEKVVKVELQITSLKNESGKDFVFRYTKEADQSFENQSGNTNKEPR